MHAAPIDLRCEYRCDPVGLDNPHPRFSWRLPPAHPEARQHAYELQVANTRATLEAGTPLHWTSGRVASNASTQIIYDGPPLASGTRYFWRVRIWDSGNSRSDWSPTATWMTGLFDTASWGKTDWIGLAVDPGSASELLDLIRAASWIAPSDSIAIAPESITDVAFRKTFTLPDTPIERAVLVAATSSNLVLEVNQIPLVICQGYQPAVAVDITTLLAPGENHITATVVHEGKPEVPIGLRVAARVECAEGQDVKTATDGSWRVTATPPARWKLPTFDATTWPTARPVTTGTEDLGEVDEVIDEHRPVPAVYLRREWEVSENVASAALHVIGLGYHEVYINGQRVGDHVLDPALTDYRKRTLSVTHDVSHLLTRGTNAIGVILGNARFFAPRRRITIPSLHIGDPRLRMQLEWTTTRGCRDRICSDRTWVATTDGPIRANNDYDGERYDARREFPGWTTAGFDARDWRSVRTYPALGAKPVAQVAEPIRVTERIKPRTVTSPAAGVQVYDFGQNLVGWVRLKVRGPRGTCVRLRHAERTRDDGHLLIAGLRSCHATDVFTLRGDDAEVYEPRFTYHGFRYVELTGLAQPPAIDNIEACVVHSDVERVGHFECSDPTLNRIYENFVWGVRGNLRSIPTDCPQRDERQGWLGDIATISKGENCVFRMINFYRKWLADIQDAQRDDGSLPDVAPPYWQLYSGNVTWPAAYVMITAWLYEQYGDIELVRQHYPSICRWLTHLRAQYRDGVLDYDTYGDWCVPPESPELIHSKDLARQTDGKLLAMAFHAHLLRLTARMARVLNNPEDGARLAAEADDVARNFHTRFYDAERHCYGNGTQTSFALSLGCGLVPDAERAAVVAAFARRVREQDDGHIATGLVGGQWLLRSLVDGGHAELALQIAQQRTYPSWGYMVDQGATTFWELWNGDTADPAMNSHNHLMLAGDLPLFLFERLAGIQACWDAPGYERFILAPCFVTGLSHVTAHHDSVRGTIRSAWRRDGNTIHYAATIPPNTAATVHLGGVERPITRIALDGKPLPATAVPSVELSSGEHAFEIHT